MVLRKAAPADYLQIGNVYCLSWKEGYKNILPQDFLNSLTAEKCAPRPENINENNNFVAEIDGVIVGLVNYGESRDNPDENMGELRSIYVLPCFWEKGIGRELFKNAYSESERTGFDGFYLWTLKENCRSRKFYEKMGMRCTDTEREIFIGGKSFTEIKYIIEFKNKT